MNFKSWFNGISKQWNNTKCLNTTFFLFCLLEVVVIILMIISFKKQDSSDDEGNMDYTSIVGLPEFMIDFSKSLKKARLHSRGVKTRTELNHAIKIMDGFFKAKQTSFDTITKRKDNTYSYVCPEVFESIEYDYPRYEQNYYTQQCEGAAPTSSFLTIAVVLTRNNQLNIKQFISDVHSIYPNLTILIGLMDIKDVVTINSQNVSVKTYNQKSYGYVLNDLIADTKTDYVLIFQNVRHFSNDINILRLVREIQRLNVKAIGGAIVDSDNHWRIGCFQRAFINFTLVFQQGYDESLHDCLFCDHLDGPFIVRSIDAKTVKFDTDLSSMGVFEDFFMRLKGELAVCPDIMFHVQTEEKSSSPSDWMSFANKLRLKRLAFPTGIDIQFKGN